MASGMRATMDGIPAGLINEEEEKPMKKIVTLLLSLILTVSYCAAFAQETTISFAIHVSNCEEQEPAVWGVLQAFQAANPDVKIEMIENITEDHITQMKLKAQNNELPDIFWCTEGDVAEYRDNGYLLALNDFLAANPGVDGAISEAIKECYAGDDGMIYGLAYTSLVTGFYYNKAIFDECGIAYPGDDTTYGEFLEMAEKIKAAGKTPLTQGTMTNYSVWGYLDSLLRYGYSENVDKLVAREESAAIFTGLFEKLYELGEKGAYPENMSTMDYFEAKNLFTSGNAAVFTSGQWDALEVGQALGEDAGFWWGMTFEDSAYSQKTINQFANAPFVVSAKVGEDEAKKEAVYRFLSFYYGPEGSAILLENSNMPAANYEGLSFENDNPAFKAISQALTNGNPSPSAANPVASLSTIVNEPFYDALCSLMLNNITPQEAVEAIDAAFDEAAM